MKLIALGAVAACTVAMSATAYAGCVQAVPGDGAWNVQFVNNCPYPVIVTWYCAGNCATGCATNRIPPRRRDPGYCHNGPLSFKYTQWP